MALQPQTRNRALGLNPHSILSDMRVNHGPASLLGLYFLHVEMATRERGIALEFCQPDELVAANKANEANWRPLVPMCDPRNGLATAETSVHVIGRNATGDVVTSNSAILYDWRGTDFVEEASSLRLFYAAPAQAKQKGEACIVTAAGAREISGMAVYSGAAWVRPDYRGMGLSELLPRFIKACAVARWPLDWIFGLMAEDVQARGFAPRFGYDHQAWEANWINSVWGPHYRMAVLWTDVEGLAKDLQGALDRHSTTQVDSVVLDRNAN